jgi:quercetin dioxygenase-like cupin family protein
MRVFEIAPGGYTPRHDHGWEHEVLVLAGEGVVWSEDGEQRLVEGDTVLVAPGEKHQFRNEGDAVFRFVCLIPNQR